MSFYFDIKKENSIKLNHCILHHPRFEAETIRVKL